MAWTVQNRNVSKTLEQPSHIMHLACLAASRVRSVASILPVVAVGGASSGGRLHNVRRAVNTVDRFSIRLGVFLKRYPKARLFTLLYVVRWLRLAVTPASI